MTLISQDNEFTKKADLPIELVRIIESKIDLNNDECGSFSIDESIKYGKYNHILGSGDVYGHESTHDSLDRDIAPCTNGGMRLVIENLTVLADNEDESLQLIPEEWGYNYIY